MAKTFRYALYLLAALILLVWVSGNWRVTFRFNEKDAEVVDYEDYH